MVLEAPAFRRADWQRARARRQPATRPSRRPSSWPSSRPAAEPGSRLGTKEELRACAAASRSAPSTRRCAWCRRAAWSRCARAGWAGCSPAASRRWSGWATRCSRIDDDAMSVADAVRIRDALDPLLVAGRGAAPLGAPTSRRCGRGCGGCGPRPTRSTGTSSCAPTGRCTRASPEISPSVMLRSFYLQPARDDRVAHAVGAVGRRRPAAAGVPAGAATGCTRTWSRPSPRRTRRGRSSC